MLVTSSFLLLILFITFGNLKSSNVSVQCKSMEIISEKILASCRQQWNLTSSEINLNFKNLSAITANSFINYPNLLILNIYHNKLTRLTSKDFTGLLNLTFLRVSHNQIRSIESGTFAHLTRLVWLDLKYNDLAVIDHTLFKPLASLSMLCLNGNRILDFNQTLRNVKSLTLKNLWYIDVSDMRLEEARETDGSGDGRYEESSGVLVAAVVVCSGIFGFLVCCVYLAARG